MSEEEKCKKCNVSINSSDSGTCELCSNDEDFLFCNFCLKMCEGCSDSYCKDCDIIHICNNCQVNYCENCMPNAYCWTCKRGYYCEDCMDEHSKQCNKKISKTKSNKKKNFPKKNIK